MDMSRYHKIGLSVLLTWFWVILVQAEPLDTVVAVVNDNVITGSELEQQVAMMKQQEDMKKLEAPSSEALKKQVLQHMIDVNLQLQLAKEHKLTVEPAELEDALRRIAINNHISVEALQAAVEGQGMPWKTYRDNISKELLLSHLQQQAVGQKVHVTKTQIEQFLKTAPPADAKERIYHLNNIVVPLPEAPSTEALQKAKQKADELLVRLKKGEDFSRLAIEASSGEFALEGGDLGERHLAELPEIFSQVVVQMQKDQVVGPIRTPAGYQLLKLVDVQGAEQRHVVRKTHVRHILLKPDPGMTLTEAQNQTERIYLLLKSGKPFDLMAKQYSLDVGSAAKGGDLGWVTPGEVVPEFEKVMDGLPPNTISKPIKSRFGWHIIEVLAREEKDDSEAFREQQVRQFLQQRQFMEAVQDWQQHLRAQAYIKILDKSLA